MRWQRAWKWVAPATVAVVSSVVAVSACRPKSFSDDQDQDGGDGGPCVCPMSEGTATLNIPCGGTACVGGNLYLCSDTDPIPEGVCGDAAIPDDDSGGGYDSGCDPSGSCDSYSCGQPNGCGGICGCAPGVPCSGGICGNGCALLAGAICLDLDASLGDPNDCCEQGNACRALDSGISVCCAQTNTPTVMGGLCSQDTDCCSYPAVKCRTDAGTCQ